MFHGDILDSFWMSTRQPCRWNPGRELHSAIPPWSSNPILCCNMIFQHRYTWHLYSCIMLHSFRYRHIDIKQALGGSRPMIKSPIEFDDFHRFIPLQSSFTHHQTWQWKTHHLLRWISRHKPPVSSRIFQPATFDCRRLKSWDVAIFSEEVYAGTCADGCCLGSLTIGIWHKNPTISGRMMVSYG